MDTKGLKVQDNSIEQNTSDSDKMRLALESACIYSTFLCLGLSSGILGPTMVHLELLYNTDTQGISVALMGLNIGILIGSGLCSLIFDRINRKLSFSLGNLLIGASLIAAPQLPHIYGFHACIMLMAVGHGFLVSGGSPYIMELWCGHRLQAPIMQGVHATWALGAFICPFLTIPFLVEIPSKQFETIDNETNVVTHTGALNVTDVAGYANDNSTHEASMRIPEGIEKVKYAYLTVGLIIIIVAIFCVVVLFLTNSSLRKKQPTNSDSESRLSSTSSNLNRWMVCKIAILVVVFLFCMCYFWYDFIPGTFMSAYVIKGLQWPVERGALMTALYYGCAGLGKVIGVPVSYVLSPTHMLFIGTASAFIGYVLMALSLLYYDHLIWVASALAGLSVATAFPTIILWTGGHMTMTGALGGMFLVAASCGGLAGSFIGGALFDKMPLSIPYLAISACIVNIVLFIVANIIAKLYEKRPRSGESETGEYSDKNVGEERKFLPTDNNDITDKSV